MTLTRTNRKGGRRSRRQQGGVDDGTNFDVNHLFKDVKNAAKPHLDKLTKKFSTTFKTQPSAIKNTITYPASANSRPNPYGIPMPPPSLIRQRTLSVGGKKRRTRRRHRGGNPWSRPVSSSNKSCVSSNGGRRTRYRKKRHSKHKK